MVSLDSGRLEVSGADIVYSLDGAEAWRLPISDIRAFGEFTIESLGDDYFFAAVASDREGWYQASFYAQGRDAFLEQLGQRLGAELRCSLCNVTDFRSAVLWPPSLAGQPMFEFRSPGFLGKVGMSKTFSLHPSIQALSAK